MSLLLDYANLVAAAFNLVFAALITYEARRLRIGTPRVVVLLVLYFLFAGLNRFADPDPVLGYSPLADHLLDLVVVVILVVLLLHARNVAALIASAFVTARHRADEYERARRDYAQLARHRMMNPVMAVKGAAQTLAAGRVRDEETRGDLLQVILKASEELERLSLQPERRATAERGLDALPRDVE